MCVYSFRWAPPYRRWCTCTTNTYNAYTLSMCPVQIYFSDFPVSSLSKHYHLFHSSWLIRLKHAAHILLLFFFYSSDSFFCCCFVLFISILFRKLLNPYEISSNHWLNRFYYCALLILAFILSYLSLSSHSPYISLSPYHSRRVIILEPLVTLIVKSKRNLIKISGNQSFQYIWLAVHFFAAFQIFVHHVDLEWIFTFIWYRKKKSKIFQLASVRSFIHTFELFQTLNVYKIIWQ